MDLLGNDDLWLHFPFRHVNRPRDKRKERPTTSLSTSDQIYFGYMSVLSDTINKMSNAAYVIKNVRTDFGGYPLLTMGKSASVWGSWRKRETNGLHNPNFHSNSPAMESIFRILLQSRHICKYGRQSDPSWTLRIRARLPRR